jgi:hypothetical protein
MSMVFWEVLACFCKRKVSESSFFPEFLGNEEGFSAGCTHGGHVYRI